MEELVGKLWHRIITGSARTNFPQAAVSLEEMRKTVGVFFRALGGDAGLKLEAAMATENRARRRWLQRVAGSHGRVELSWRDTEALRLPACIDVFPERALNRDLYLWLAALAAEDTAGERDWFGYNQWLTCRVLHRFPGLTERYRHLVEAQLALRPNPAQLPSEEAAQERALQAALQHPGTIAQLPAARRPPQTVYLWLHPNPPRHTLDSNAKDLPDAPAAGQDGESREAKDKRRQRAERVEMPDGKRGLVLDRFENIFSWAEYVKVDRSTQEDDDLDAAEEAAKDLDMLSVARDTRGSASRLRLDLDLPAAASDDLPLGEGILFPEWDYRRGSLRADYCSVQPMIAADAKPCELPGTLRPMARRLRNQFDALMPARMWHRAQQEGSEIDLDAYLQHTTDCALGHTHAGEGMYRDYRRGVRDLSCLLLADLSLSTDAWVNNSARVIDVIRDSLYLFSEALSATSDRFALYGFSSRHRSHVRIHTLKAFNETYGPLVRGRIAAIKPGFYTRMGTAIRYATQQLAGQPGAQRLLLLLTDGKPNDLDQYEGRYGAEDTRMAIIEARRQGLQPFCVTIDDEAADYLPHLFGNAGFVLIRRPAELPRRLPLLYAQLTR